MDADTRALWDDFLARDRVLTGSRVAQLRWICGFEGLPVPTDADVVAECARSGVAVPDDLDMDPAMFTPGAYGPPERRAEHAATMAALRAGDGEHVDLG